MARVAGTLETTELPRSLPKTVPPARAAVLLTQGLLQGPVLGGMRPLPARSLHKEGHPISKGLFAERPPGLKGQQPEPQPASCHQGPCCFADNKPWDKLRLERETESKPENLPGLTKLPEPQLQGSAGACGPPSGHAGGGRGTGMRADGGICPRSCSQLTSTK